MHPLVIVAVAALAVAGCSATASPPASAAPSNPVTAEPSASVSSPVPPPASVAATASASATPSIALNRTFRSKVYHYTIGLAADWTVSPATVRADDPTSTEATATDVITVTGTDTTIQTVASDLGGQPFDAWLRDYRAAMSSSVPPGCDGGDPATWPAVAVGPLQGVWQQKCNAGLAIVEYRGEAYQIAWENGTFSSEQHLPVADFRSVLRSVTFP